MVVDGLFVYVCMYGMGWDGGVREAYFWRWVTTPVLAITCVWRGGEGRVSWFAADM